VLVLFPHLSTSYTVSLFYDYHDAKINYQTHHDRSMLPYEEAEFN
jgi:hypothetical protein